MFLIYLLVYKVCFLRLHRTQVKYYERAAEFNIPDTLNNLGYMYSKGRGVPKDYGKAVKYYEKAVKKGSVLAMNNFAALCKEMKNFDRAIFLYNKAIKERNAPAAYSLALMYHYDHGVPKNVERDERLTKAKVLYGLAKSFSKEYPVYEIFCDRQLKKVCKKLEDLKRKEENRKQLAKEIRLTQEHKKEKEEEEQRKLQQLTNTQKDKQLAPRKKQPVENDTPPIEISLPISNPQEETRGELLKKQKEEENFKLERERKKKERQKKDPSSQIKPKKKAPIQNSSEESDSAGESSSNKFDNLTPNLQGRIRDIFDVFLSPERKGMEISLENAKTVFRGLYYTIKKAKGDHIKVKTPKNTETEKHQVMPFDGKNLDAGAIESLVNTLLLDGIYPPEREKDLKEESAFKYYAEKRPQKNKSSNSINTEPGTIKKEISPKKQKKREKKEKKEKKEN